MKAYKTRIKAAAQPGVLHFEVSRHLSGFLLMIMLVILWVPAAAAKDSHPGEYVPPDAGVEQSIKPPLLDLLRKSSQPPVAIIASAEKSAPAKLDALRAWNKIGTVPSQNGFSHPLQTPLLVKFSSAPYPVETVNITNNRPGRTLQTNDGTRVWSASVKVDESYRLRLHLNKVELSGPVKMWVYGDDGELAGPFDQGMIDDTGNLWTPSVAGPSIHLVAVIPDVSTSAQFNISSVVEIFQLDFNGQPVLNSSKVQDLSCLLKAQCVSAMDFSAIEEAEKSVARYAFLEGGSSYLCSGGLINDTVAESTIAYFLTANHCISTQASASSVEAFWDYKPKTCGGSSPPLGSLPRSNGSTLLVTGTTGDYTLLRLNAVPTGSNGRFFMGWDARASAIPANTVLHRIAHPQGMVQHYSQTRVLSDADAYFCEGLPTTRYIFQQDVTGGTAGGSSGGPLMLDNGQIVGQLYGACGDDPDNACDMANQTVDGKLNSYWSSVQTYLDPSSMPTGAPDLVVVNPVVNNDTPLLGENFSVSVTLRNAGDARSDSTTLHYYRSSNSTISASDMTMASDPVPVLAAGSTSPQNATVSISTPGIYWVGACVIAVSNESNTGNNCSPGVQVNVQQQTQLVRPTGISASDGLFADHVRISWTGVAGATVYRLFRCTSSSTDSCGFPIKFPGGNSYDDMGGVAGTIYYYRVKACIPGECSAFSVANTGYRGGAVSKPMAPTGFQASDGAFADRVRLSWNGVPGATVYRVFRCTSSATGSCGLPIKFPKGLSFDDTGGSSGKNYWYRVKACTQNQCSPFSAANTGFRAVSKLQAPTGVRASDGTFSDRVSVGWNGVTGATVYRLFRCTSSTTGSCGLPVKFPKGTGFDDRGGVNNTIYWYRVKACTPDRCSSFSVANTGYRNR